MAGSRQICGWTLVWLHDFLLLRQLLQLLWFFPSFFFFVEDCINLWDSFVCGSLGSDLAFRLGLSGQWYAQVVQRLILRILLTLGQFCFRYCICIASVLFLFLFCCLVAAGIAVFWFRAFSAFGCDRGCFPVLFAVIELYACMRHADLPLSCP